MNLLDKLENPKYCFCKSCVKNNKCYLIRIKECLGCNFKLCNNEYGIMIGCNYHKENDINEKTI